MCDICNGKYTPAEYRELLNTGLLGLVGNGR